MTYGSAIGLVFAGVACAAFITGVTGQVVGLALLGTGLVILTGLAFLEVGLSEDRERAKESVPRSPAPPPRRVDDARLPRQRGPRHER
jgi:hypothetical protein